MEQVEIFSGLKLVVAQAPTRKLRELQGLGGLSPPAVTALENTIQALLEAGGLVVDSVTITHISDDGSGVLDITYKAMLNVSPDTTEQEAQQQADAQLQESMLDECVDNCFSTELQTSLEEVGDNCGDVTCDDLLNAEVTVSTVSICGCHVMESSIKLASTYLLISPSLCVSLQATPTFNPTSSPSVSPSKAPTSSPSDEVSVYLFCWTYHVHLIY